MLIALITVLLLGGGPSATLSFIADTDDEVKIVVPRGERQKAARGTLKAMKKRTKANRKHLRKAKKNLFKALEDFDPDQPEIEQIWDAHFAEVEAFNEDMLDLRFQLRDQLSRQEWGEIFSSDPEE